MVNTFLVHSNYNLSAKMLDNRRLGKQRVEAYQIITAILAFHGTMPETDITNKSRKSWINHPATKSWKDHIGSLKLYFNAIVREWIDRGYKNNYDYYILSAEENKLPPIWTSNPKIHYSMMAQLVQKEPSYYNADNLRDKIPLDLYDYFLSMPSEYMNYGYIWPCNYTIEELNNLVVSDLAGAYIKRSFCQGHYKNGNPCRNKALSSTKFMFCGLHYNFNMLKM